MDVDELLAGAVPRIQAEFSKMGWSAEAVTDGLWAELKVQKAELVALRLYTGPLFIVYNQALRAMATLRDHATLMEALKAAGVHKVGHRIKLEKVIRELPLPPHGATGAASLAQ